MGFQEGAMLNDIYVSRSTPFNMCLAFLLFCFAVANLSMRSRCTDFLSDGVGVEHDADGRTESARRNVLAGRCTDNTRIGV